MDELGKHDAKGKKSITVGHILYIKHPEQTNVYTQKIEERLPKAGGEWGVWGEYRSTARGYSFLSEW